MAGGKNVERVVQVEGLNQLLRVLNKLPKDLQKDLRDASVDIADMLVSGARGAATTPLQTLVAQGLKARRDRIPVVTTGRGKVSDTARMPDVFYGAEFGGRRRPTTQQFLEHRGRRGYFLYPTARAQGRRYAGLWADAVDKAFKDWDNRKAAGG